MELRAEEEETPKLDLRQTMVAPGHGEAAKSPPDDGNDKMMTNS